MRLYVTISRQAKLMQIKVKEINLSLRVDSIGWAGSVVGWALPTLLFSIKRKLNNKLCTFTR